MTANKKNPFMRLIERLWPVIPLPMREESRLKILTDNHQNLRLVSIAVAVVFIVYLIQYYFFPEKDLAVHPHIFHLYIYVFTGLVLWSLLSTGIQTVLFKRIPENGVIFLQFMAAWGTLLLCGALTGLDLSKSDDYSALFVSSLTIALFLRSKWIYYLIMYSLSPVAALFILGYLKGNQEPSRVLPLFVFSFVAFLISMVIEGGRRKYFLLQCELKEMAIHDSLTGIYNRGYFMESIDRMIAGNIRLSMPICCMIIDLDWFKAVNDDFGHLAGDEVLKFIAASLNGSIRASDLLARYGGEEFIVLLSGASITNATIVAERMRIKISELTYPSINRKLTISCGLAELNKGEKVEDWINRADQKLYLAKQKGRNRTES